MEDFDGVIFQHYYHSNLSDLPVKRKRDKVDIIWKGKK